jgi:hypothetical protein
MNGRELRRGSCRGSSAVELALSTLVVVVFGMGLYFLGQRGLGRLQHYICTMSGSPYQ